MDNKMSMIKNFFKKKKSEKGMGPGRKLNSTESGPPSTSSKSKKDVYVPPQRKNNDLSDEAR